MIFRNVLHCVILTFGIIFAEVKNENIFTHNTNLVETHDNNRLRINKKNNELMKSIHLESDLELLGNSFDIDSPSLYPTTSPTPKNMTESPTVSPFDDDDGDNSVHISYKSNSSALIPGVFMLLLGILVLFWILINLLSFFPHYFHINLSLQQLPKLSTEECCALLPFTFLLFMTSVDMTLYRYLPWKRTKFTKYMQAYPNLTIFIVCFLSTAISNILQLIGSIYNVSLIQKAMSSSNDDNNNHSYSVLYVSRSYFLLVMSIIVTVRSLMSLISFFDVFFDEKYYDEVFNNPESINNQRDSNTSRQSEMVNRGIQNPELNNNNNNPAAHQASVERSTSPFAVAYVANRNMRGTTVVASPIAIVTTAIRNSLFGRPSAVRNSNDLTANINENNNNYNSNNNNSNNNNNNNGQISSSLESVPTNPLMNYINNNMGPPSNRESSANESMDDRGIRFSQYVEYTEATITLLKQERMSTFYQQKESIINVEAEIIPFSQISHEINHNFDLIHNKQIHQEDRLMYLIFCVELNNDYKSIFMKKTIEYKNEKMNLCRQSYDIMKQLIPENIFMIKNLQEFSNRKEGSGVQVQQSDEKMNDNKLLSYEERIMKLPCLWLIHITTDEMESIHEDEWMEKFSIENISIDNKVEELDIIEIAAIFHSIPITFKVDINCKKERWRSSVEYYFKKLVLLQNKGVLPLHLKRNPSYPIL
eukprot:gene5246-7291_t